MRKEICFVPGGIKQTETDAGQASMTVEAVFVMTLLLLVLMWIMVTAIEMYQQVGEAAKLNWADVQEAAQDFRIIYFGKKWLP